MKKSPAKKSRIFLFILILFFGITKLFISPENTTDVFGKIGGATAQYFTAIYQIASAILVIMPSTAFIGALMIAISMVVAILLHSTIIGLQGPMLVITILAVVILIISIKVMKKTRGILLKKK